MADIDLTTYDDGALDRLLIDVQTERERRQVMAQALEQADDLAKRFLRARDGDLDPDAPPAWVQPTGAHDAYRKFYVVEHDGKRWESTAPANVFEPGTEGWREVTTDAPPTPEWTPPARPEDGYPKGAKVAHANEAWRSEVDQNDQEPGVSGWAKQ